MTLPTPEAGLVIRYSYLWLREHKAGREEGTKDRPCAIIVATEDRDGATHVLVVPITRGIVSARYRDEDGIRSGAAAESCAARDEAVFRPSKKCQRNVMAAQLRPVLRSA